MDKKKLLKFIGMYTLGGSVEAVTWKSTDKQISTNFVSADKTVMGTVESNISVGDFEFGIYDTTRLTRMLSVLDDEVDIVVNSNNGKNISLFISGKLAKVSFGLTEKDQIPKPPSLKMKPTFTTTIKLDNNFRTHFQKANGALSETNFFTVEYDGLGGVCTFGYDDTNSNKIIFDIDTQSTEDLQPIHYSSIHVSEILNANKDCDGIMEISPVGLARITYTTNEYKSEYYLVNKEIE